MPFCAVRDVDVYPVRLTLHCAAHDMPDLDLTHLQNLKSRRAVQNICCAGTRSTKGRALTATCGSDQLL